MTASSEPAPVRCEADPRLELELWRLRASDHDAPYPFLGRRLADRLGCRTNELSFGRERCPECGGPDGRPVLAEPNGTVHFSIARDRGYTLIGVAAVPVGVDLEAVCAPETADEVAALLSPAEQELLCSAPRARRAELFTRLWTRKEAYLKGLGTGIAHGVDASHADPGWSLLDLEVAEGYAAAVALKTPDAD